MKEILVAAGLLFGTQAYAVDFGDVIGGLIAVGENHNDQYRPGPGPGHPGYPGRPGRPPRRPGYPGYPDEPGYGGRIQCIAVDAGHEEHWGGHGSCGECLSRHGECNETCEQVSDFVQCQYEGRDRRGYSQIFTGRDEFRQRAEQDAYYQCSRYYRDCRFVRCDRVLDRRIVSQGRCDRWGRGPGRR